MVEAGIVGEKAFQHGAEQKHAAAFERLLVERDRDLPVPRAAPLPSALADASHDRPAVDAADAADLAFGRVVGRSANSDSISRKRWRAVAGAAFDEPEIIQAEHVDQPPSDDADAGDFAAAAQLRDHGLARAASGRQRRPDRATYRRAAGSRRRLGRPADVR